MSKILEEIQQVNPDNPLEYCRQIIAPFAVDKLNNIINTCVHCKTASYNHRTTKGNPNANILLVTDNATNDDNVYDYLDQMLEQSGIDTDDVFMINAVSCINTRGKGENAVVRNPSNDELCSCKLYVEHAIDIVKPRVIILMGATSLNLFNKAIFDQEISSWMRVKDIPAMVTYSAQDMFLFMEYVEDDELEDKATVMLNDLVTANNYLNSLK